MTDVDGVSLALRHPISAVLLALAFLGTVAVFTVARPQYEPAVEIENLDLAKVRHYSVSEVRAAFGEQGIRFTETVDDPASGMTLLGAGPRPWDVTGLSVTILPENGHVGLGHGEDGIFESRVGNVLVQYGGEDEGLLAQVKRAIATLRPVRPPRGP